jgi:magnesium chelatase family protein
MLATTHAACLIGIEANPVQVEVRLGEGLPGFDIVGLPERAVRESRIRVRAALSSIGFTFPPRHLVLNLAPGDLPKTGAGLDLAIAVSGLGRVRRSFERSTGEHAVDRRVVALG